MVAQGTNLRNIVDVRSADEFVAYLHEAANLDRKTGRARLVCVEYFAGWCHACRSVHPKLGKMAEKEFPACSSSGCTETCGLCRSSR